MVGRPRVVADVGATGNGITGPTAIILIQCIRIIRASTRDQTAITEEGQVGILEGGVLEVEQVEVLEVEVEQVEVLEVVVEQVEVFNDLCLVYDAHEAQFMRFTRIKNAGESKKTIFRDVHGT